MLLEHACAEMWAGVALYTRHTSDKSNWRDADTSAPLNPQVMSLEIQ